MAHFILIIQNIDKCLEMAEEIGTATVSLTVTEGKRACIYFVL